MPAHIRPLRAPKWNAVLLKILVVWENMFKSDLLDTLHIPASCSGLSSSCAEQSSEALPCASSLLLWQSSIVKTAIFRVIYTPDCSGQQTVASQKHFDLFFWDENEVLFFEGQDRHVGGKNTEAPVTCSCCMADGRARVPG